MKFLGFFINHYNLGASFCRKLRKNGGVSIFVHQNLQCSPIDLEEFCTDQEIEVCAVKLHHRNSLETILNKLYTKSINIILCGDVNINYLDNAGTNKIKFLTNHISLMQYRLPY
jgi:hypothetical protein